MSTYDRLREKYTGCTVATEVDGNFTIAEVNWNGHRVIGVAKCNAEQDRFSLPRGMEIAYARALRKLDARLNINARPKIALRQDSLESEVFIRSTR